MVRQQGNLGLHGCKRGRVAIIRKTSGWQLGVLWGLIGLFGVFSAAQAVPSIGVPTTVRLCIDPDWHPFESVTPDGKQVGIAHDLRQLIDERAALSFKLVPTKTWDESLLKARAGECDALSLLNETPVRPC